MQKRFEIERANAVPTRLFLSFNSAHQSLHVLAADHDTAVNIAWAAGHIRHSENGLEGDDRRMHECLSIESEFRTKDWHPLMKAAIEGRQGTVSLDGDDIYLGEAKLI